MVQDDTLYKLTYFMSWRTNSGYRLIG